MKEKIRNLKKQLSKEQESSRTSLAKEQEISRILSNERSNLMVVLNVTKQQHALAATATKLQLENMRAELESSKRRFDSVAASDFRTNQCLESKVLHLEAKIGEQEEKIRKSEIAELVRKEQKQKREAGGIKKRKETKAMEAATGVEIKKRKRKPSSQETAKFN